MFKVTSPYRVVRSMPSLAKPLRNTISLTSLSILSMLLSANSFAASFDCSLAKAKIEKMICDNPSISQMDEVVHTLYFNVLKQDSSIKQEQRAWLKQRNFACTTPFYCEKAFADRINQLIDRQHIGQHDLTEGMTLPDINSLDELSLAGMTREVVKEKYRPWPRKPLLTVNGYLSRPQAAVVNDELFIYYIANVNKVATLFEYSPATGKTFAITNDSLRIATSVSYFIEEGKLHFFSIQDGSINSKTITEHQYLLGTELAPGVLNVFRHYDEERYVEYRPSGDEMALSYGRGKLAITANAMNNDRFQIVSKDGPYFAKAQQVTDLAAAKKLNSIVIYDVETNQSEIISDNAFASGWYINSLAWSFDDQSVFFDNSGNWACIWEYDLASKQLHKIVPEHSASSPFSFHYQGNDYILYEDSIRGETYADLKGLLMLAVRPK